MSSSPFSHRKAFIIIARDLSDYCYYYYSAAIFVSGDMMGDSPKHRTLVVSDFSNKKRIHFSKLYSFSCLKSPLRDGHSHVGQKGYSRVVYCNDPDNPKAVQLSYGGNYVSTTKYTAFNFIPKSLFEQFRRVANIYFLVVACVSFSPLAPFTALSIVAPLLVVIGATMAKEAVEDWRRRKRVEKLHYLSMLWD